MKENSAYVTMNFTKAVTRAPNKAVVVASGLELRSAVSSWIPGVFYISARGLKETETYQVRIVKDRYYNFLKCEESGAFDTTTYDEDAAVIQWGVRPITDSVDSRGRLVDSNGKETVANISLQQQDHTVDPAGNSIIQAALQLNDRASANFPKVDITEYGVLIFEDRQAGGANPGDDQRLRLCAPIHRQNYKTYTRFASIHKLGVV